MSCSRSLPRPSCKVTAVWLGPSPCSCPPAEPQLNADAPRPCSRKGPPGQRRGRGTDGRQLMQTASVGTPLRVHTQRGAPQPWSAPCTCPPAVQRHPVCPAFPRVPGCQGVGEGGDRAAPRTSRAASLLCVTLKWWTHVCVSVQTHRLYNSKSDPKVTVGLRWWLCCVRVRPSVVISLLSGGAADYAWGAGGVRESLYLPLSLAVKPELS